MGIDGIGNGGRIPPGGAGGVGGKSPATGASETGRAFDVRADKPVGPATSQGVGGTSHAERTPLDRLRAGEIDVNGYVDLKVDAATHALPQGLSRAELDQIRSTLRHQIAHDPAVMDLVKQATGALPKPESE